MADESPERVLGDITNRQRSQNPSPRRPQARRSRGSLPVNENTPFPTAAPRTVTQIQGEPLHFAGSSAISSPVASSSPSAAAAPTSTQPMIDLRLRVPADYPPLEPVCDSQVPLHFTWTEVRGISDSEDPFCERVDAMTTEIRDEFREREYLLWWGVVFCQVEKPHVLIREEEELARSQNREFKEVYPPRLLAVQATPTLMHRHWREAHEILQRAILRHFGTEFDLPIRFYYETPDEGMMQQSYGSPGPFPPLLPATPVLSPGATPPAPSTGSPPPALPRSIEQARLRAAKEHQPKELRNMGTTIGLKDGDRYTTPNGTLGCFVRLRDSNQNLLPDVFALTAHHVVSTTTGDQLPPPPARGKDPLAAARLRIAHPPTRDVENNKVTLQERIEGYEKQIEHLKTAIEDEPATNLPDIREQMILRLEDEKAVDEYQLAQDTEFGHEGIGRVWATSGRTYVNAPTKFQGVKSQAKEKWLADWALIQMDPGKEGQNLLPPAIMWPADYPEDFDDLRAHGAITGIGAAKSGDLVAYVGRSGIHFGHIQHERRQALIRNVDSTLLPKKKDGRPGTVDLSSKEFVILGIHDEIPFGWNGDSGAIVVNMSGQIVGIFHGGRPGVLDRRPCYFTPAQDLVDDIERKTGHTVECIIPQIPRPYPEPTFLRRATKAATVSNSVADIDTAEGGQVQGAEPVAAAKEVVGKGKGKEKEKDDPVQGAEPVAGVKKGKKGKDPSSSGEPKGKGKKKGARGFSGSFSEVTVPADTPAAEQPGTLRRLRNRASRFFTLRRNQETDITSAAPPKERRRLSSIWTGPVQTPRDPTPEAQ